jgi:DNA-binding GntR family transcriptional regulator
VIPDLREADPRAYIRLAARYREKISDGSITPGHFVPSITRLSRDLDLARGTCSKAMQVLAQEGLLIRIPGLGYYIPERAA